MLAVKNSLTLPGWRDFEPAVALAFGGESAESKAVFDILLRSKANPDIHYGLSCKMRKELNRIRRDGRVTIELSNSSGQFWDRLAAQEITSANYKQHALEVGTTLINLVQRWHLAVSIHQHGSVDLARSSYLVLSWNNAGVYQLHQFPIVLPDPQTLRWHFPVKQVQGVDQQSRRLSGDDTHGALFEWYGESGGQLKYYPFASSATWESTPFSLEPLPNMEHGILAKVDAYFPKLWKAANL